MKNYSEEFINKVIYYTEDEFGVDNVGEYDAEDIFDIIMKMFEETYGGREYIGEELIPESGEIYIPAYIKGKDGKRFASVVEFDTNKSKVKYKEIFILAPGMGLVNIFSYISYLGDWADDFEPYAVQESNIEIL